MNNYLIVFVLAIAGLLFFFKGDKIRTDPRDPEVDDPRDPEREKDRLKNILENEGYKSFLRVNRMEEYIRQRNPYINDQEIDQIIYSVMKYSSKYRVNPYYIFAIIDQESTFDPEANGRDGEIGLMQLMPIAFQEVIRNYENEFETVNRSWLYKIDYNIKAGVLFYTICRDHAGNLWETLAIYNEWVNYKSAGSNYADLVEQRIINMVERGI